MGEKTTSLRVKRLSDLIHGASIDRAVSNRASVSAIFVREDGSEQTFTRSIIGSSAEHRIDNEVVSSQQYHKELENLKINVNAKNFLVFQGAVESIAMKNPKERTMLFEEISGSLIKKQEYETSLKELHQAEEESQSCFQKKKTILKQQKEAVCEKKEADKHNELTQNLSSKQQELQLFKIYHCERKIDKYNGDWFEKRDKVTNIEKENEKLEKELKEAKK